MLGTTFSFWRSLVGKTRKAADAPPDRRLWVRYPSNLQTNVQLAGERPADNRFSAEVRDISVGGVNLVADRPIESGQMLSLELPQAGDGDRHTVLACVVRAIPDGTGQWAVGCVFSRQLTDDDLEGFGAKRFRHATSDQRVWMRFTTNLRADYQKIGDPENRSHHAQVINLSVSGVGLAVSEAVEAGALLSVDLIGNDREVMRTILACVVHVTTQSSGKWSLGCNFIRELSEEEFKALI